MTTTDLLALAVTLPVLLFSLALHELAHGLTADRLGDPTPRAYGRLTLDPRRHLDLWGTIVLLVTFVGSGGTFLFGWAKPIPVNPGAMRRPQYDMALVGAAGPLCNLGLAIVAGVLYRLIGGTWTVLDVGLLAVFALNIILALLNILPIPPLDGSRVVGAFLPRGLYRQWAGLDRYANVIIAVLFAVIILRPEVMRAYFLPVLDAMSRLFLGESW